MKIRLMGQLEDVQAVADLFVGLRGKPNIRSVEASGAYRNRPPSNEYRIYIDIHFDTVPDSRAATLPDLLLSEVKT